MVRQGMQDVQKHSSTTVVELVHREVRSGNHFGYRADKGSRAQILAVRSVCPFLTRVRAWISIQIIPVHREEC